MYAARSTGGGVYMHTSIPDHCVTLITGDTTMAYSNIIKLQRLHM